MAQTPLSLNFRKEDFPDDGLSKPESLDRLFLPLNQFMKTVRDALNGGLTTANLHAELKTITIVTPASGIGVLSCFPLKVSTTISKPIGLHLVGCLDTGAAATPPALGVPSWFLNPDGTIQITNIPGLNLGRTYRITLQILGG